MSPATDVLKEISIPHETVNDDVVTIARWCFEQGAAVRSQDIVAEIETSKAVFEIEAEAEGFLDILYPEGAEVPVGALIGHVTASPAAAQSVASVETSSAEANTASAAKTSSASAVSVSKKAQRLIDEQGIDPAVFEGKGLIKEVDVIRYLEAQAEDRATSSATSRDSSVTGTDAAQATAQHLTSRSRGLFGDARASASDRGQSLPALIWNYFWRNWLFGLLVQVAPRGIINVLHRWRGVRIGDDCFIDPTATLETAYPENITMGDDVRVTVGAIIMTHIKAPDYLRDTGIMPAVLAPVVLEDHCFIGVNAVVMPGVTVGKAAVVASGAVVVSNVPPYTMVAGNPAKIVRQFPKPDGE